MGVSKEQTELVEARFPRFYSAHIPHFPLAPPPIIRVLSDPVCRLTKIRPDETDFSSAIHTLCESPDFCPEHPVYGKEPDEDCPQPSDPNELKKSPLEKWFTKQIFDDLFPKSNIGVGPHPCLPYSYESFVIAARYFPEFGASHPNKQFKADEHHKRDVAAFFAHALQETGENDASVYNNTDLTLEQAHECFYRGGFYNWFERGPNSSFLLPTSPGFSPSDGKRCTDEGQYCKDDPILNFWYPCNSDFESHSDQDYHKGCYFGRGALQLSWNYNYGLFQQFLLTKGIKVDLIENPNLVITKMDPPLAMMASLWFYMTPQPPKPSMHQIVTGDWKPSSKNRRAGYQGAIFGPTSLIINNECGGEDPDEPGGPGESRRIKAFKWFCKYFKVPVGSERTLSCKGMLDGFDAVQHMYSWHPDWGNMWKSQSCDCAPAPYGGPLPYYDPKLYPHEFTKQNDRNRLRCVYSMYESPETFRLDESNSPCLKHKPKIRLTKTGIRG
ncbi:hypothetical protein CAEBREN_24989 [Caenorhabditis brenneri]|uniref:Glycoside hydrolase family 19 catalytic domain-containing protein n=1 Tax=Caenorhabditis brenneri TaxID=135651 RepID=G0MXT7_CAEBE|nr:hypothetical protein CAEBREN_24989 [Caenorhabditis brenneri]